ncbi:MAG: hypothetical protein AAF602_13210 [Myxococcota bacterium]
MTLLVLFGSTALAIPPELVSTALTGSQARSWDVEGRPWRSYLGQKCKSGEAWSFAVDKTWTRRVCVEEKPVTTSGRWAWSTEEPETTGPFGIELDGEPHLLEIRKKAAPVPGDPPLLVLTLRTPKASSDTLTRETVLTFQDF